MSFTLHLPSTIRIHPVFHVAQLGPENPNTFEDRDQPPGPLTVDGNPEYPIELIIDPKYNRVRHRCQLLYHIKWVGYPISNNLAKEREQLRLQTSRRYRRYNTMTHSTRHHPPSSTPSPDHIRSSTAFKTSETAPRNLAIPQHFPHRITSTFRLVYYSFYSRCIVSNAIRPGTSVFRGLGRKGEILLETFVVV